MPSGIVHAQATRKVGATLTIIGAVGAIVGNPILLALPLGGWLGHVITPDSDHHKITYMEGRLLRFNRILGTLWLWYWIPYERMNPHRGRSHTWPGGTLVRMAYLLWPFIVGSFYLYFSYFYGAENFIRMLSCWLVLFVGWSIQDWVHIIQDGE